MEHGIVIVATGATEYKLTDFKRSHNSNSDNKRVAEMLKVPLTKNDFFLEAHMKLRPVDFAVDGVFLCGMAHSQNYMDESIAQACASAARAATILSKPTLGMEGIVANVNEDLCSGCRICEYLCSYGAIEMKEKDDRRIVHVIEALCKGRVVCGTACPTKAIRWDNLQRRKFSPKLRLHSWRLNHE